MRIAGVIGFLLIFIDSRVAGKSALKNANRPNDSKRSAVDWADRAQQTLARVLSYQQDWTPAKNVILFIGDGLGISTLTAARILKAQRAGLSVTEGELSWENFHNTGIIKTYNTDQITPDSAGTATSFVCGEKTRAGVIGVNQNVPRGNCEEAQKPENQLTSILQHSMFANKSTGFVTNTDITSATLATLYAHSADRDFQSDIDLPEGVTCWDIARQLVDNSTNEQIKVIFGGGRMQFYPNTSDDVEYPEMKGQRQDQRNLIEDWLEKKRALGYQENEFAYVHNSDDLEALDRSNLKFLMGLFEPEHMKYEADRQDEVPGVSREPSLTEMVSYALDILEKDDNGYFLLIESGRIDNGHHDTNAYRALQEVLTMDEAVQAVLDRTNKDDTLIVHTADHSHVFTISGYPGIDADILGLAIDQHGEVILGADDKPYTILNYANGRGYYEHRTEDGTLDTETTRMNLTGVDTTGREFLQDNAMPRSSESHGGEDVAVYATGPMSHLFVGQHEQNYIAHALMYASCVGPNQALCEGQTTSSSPEVDGAESIGRGVFHLALTSLCAILVIWVV